MTGENDSGRKAGGSGKGEKRHGGGRSSGPRTGERRENVESRELTRAGFELARRLGIRKLLVQADGVRDIRLVERNRIDEGIIWLSRGGLELPASEKSEHVVLTIPETSTLTRISQIKIALFLSVLNSYIELDESVLCLSGIVGSARLDTLLIANPRRDFPWLAKEEVGGIPDLIPMREFARLIDIALRFAAEGREGKPIGTIFVIGEIEELEPYLRQLVLNPCLGHPRSARSIHNPDFLETLREFAAMDGAFIINKGGVVEAAATYLATPVRQINLRSGLGARHAAAASITSVTEAVAIVLSESSGGIAAFHEGSPILELERPVPRDSGR